MANDWQRVTAADVAAPSRNALVGGPFGSNLVSKDYVPSGVPVIRGQNMGSRWVTGEFAFVTEAKAKSLEANLARPRDLVFTQRGTLGQVALVPSRPFEVYLISQSQMKLTVDEKKADPLFLYYVFSSQEQQEHIRQHAIQTGVPHTNLGILRDTPILLPRIEEQHAIALILGELDNKIELNTQMNNTLENTARALFKSWFVDFDPVRAKVEARDSGLPKRIADHFPDLLATSDTGEIPKGWSSMPFADTVDILGGGTPKTSVAEYWDGDIPWFSVVDAPRDSDVWVIHTEKRITQAGVDNSSTRILPERTTIISARGTVGRVALIGVPMGMNQSCYGLFGKLGRLGTFTYFSTRQLVSLLRQRAHGSVFDTITRETFAGISIPVPPKALVDAYEDITEPLMRRVRTAVFQSHTLSAMRDSLVPKLISGELRLQDAERIVGGHV